MTVVFTKRHFQGPATMLAGSERINWLSCNTLLPQLSSFSFPTCTSWLQLQFNCISILISLLSCVCCTPSGSQFNCAQPRTSTNWLNCEKRSSAQVKRVDWSGGEKVLRCLSVVFLGNWLHELIEFCFPANLVRFSLFWTRLCGTKRALPALLGSFAFENW